MAYDTIEARQETLDIFLDKHLSKKAPPKNERLNGKKHHNAMTTQTVLDRAMRSKNGEIIQALMDGKMPVSLLILRVIWFCVIIWFSSAVKSLMPTFTVSLMRFSEIQSGCGTSGIRFIALLMGSPMVK